MVDTPDQQLVISAGGTTFAIDCAEGSVPRLAWFGDDGGFVGAKPFQPQPQSWNPGVPTMPSLFSQYGFGFFGTPALSGAPAGKSAEQQFRLTEYNQDASSVRLVLADTLAELTVILSFEIDADSGVLTASTVLRNDGVQPYRLDRMSALCMPLPTWAGEVRYFDGGVFKEGHIRRCTLDGATITRTTRHGRPGHSWIPFMMACNATTSDEHGAALLLHVAHPGNTVMIAEPLGEGGGQILVGEWLEPGEVSIKPGYSYESPPCHAVVTNTGINGATARLNRFLRQRMGPVARPVQFNSWEAVYLDCDEATAMELATSAAALGAERFVLDDGWFAGRAIDAAGLGDWTPDPRKYPNGLSPLIDHVVATGMEFGLWVEPEMVNPNSNLYRAHPDWVLQVEGRPQPLWRNQLVLDLTRAEVADFVMQSIERLLRVHPIRYLKWDCNRGLFPAAGKGRAQAQAVLEIMKRIKTAFPTVSIESCASGGGRIDYATLRPCDRVWISDNTDPIERVRIQRSASIFLPLEVIGTHVGASPNPTTERGTPMVFRCLVALFGHMGMELDPRHLTETDAATLRRAFDLYKRERAFMGAAELIRLDPQIDGVDAQLLLGQDGRRGLLRVLQVDDVRPGPRTALLLYGLNSDTHYTVSEIHLDGSPPIVIGVASGGVLARNGIDALPPFASMGRLFLIEARS